MSLGKRIGGSGDITPLIKFDACSGVLYRCDRTRAADGEWYTSQENITGNFVAVFDMECMSSEHFGQLAWQFKRMSGSSGLKVQAAIAC